MRYLKRMVCFFVSLVIGVVCATSVSSHAVADSIENDELIHEQTIVSERFVDPALVGTAKGPVDQENQIIPFNVYGERHELKDTYVTNRTVYVQPTGQPGNGYVGGSGAWITFFDYGGDSYNFTVTVEFKIFSFTTDTGAVSGSGIGYSAQVPNFKNNYRFEFEKYYTIKTKKYDVYKYNIYQYSYYIQDADYSLDHRWVVVNNEGK